MAPSTIVFGKQLGGGGFGTVFKALRNGLPVIVKRILLSTVNVTTETLSFVREVILHKFVTSQDICKNIICALDYDIVLIGENLYGLLIFGESGDSLESLLEDTRPPSIDPDQLFHGISAHIDALHSAHIAHLDIKPGNILLLDAKTTRLIDLGISCIDEAFNVKALISIVTEVKEYLRLSLIRMLSTHARFHRTTREIELVIATVKSVTSESVVNCAVRQGSAIYSDEVLMKRLEDAGLSNFEIGQARDDFALGLIWLELLLWKRITSIPNAYTLSSTEIARAFFDELPSNHRHKHAIAKLLQLPSMATPLPTSLLKNGIVMLANTIMTLKWFNLRVRPNGIDIVGVRTESHFEDECELCFERLIDESANVKYFGGADMKDYPFAHLGTIARHQPNSNAPYFLCAAKPTKSGELLSQTDVFHSKCLLVYILSSFLDPNQRLRPCLSTSYETLRETVNFFDLPPHILFYMLDASPNVTDANNTEQSAPQQFYNRMKLLANATEGNWAHKGLEKLMEMKQSPSNALAARILGKIQGDSRAHVQSILRCIIRSDETQVQTLCAHASNLRPDQIFLIYSVAISSGRARMISVLIQYFTLDANTMDTLLRDAVKLEVRSTIRALLRAGFRLDESHPLAFPSEALKRLVLKPTPAQIEVISSSESYDSSSESESESESASESASASASESDSEDKVVLRRAGARIEDILGSNTKTPLLSAPTLGMIHVPQSPAISQAHEEGKSTLSIRIIFNYEADLAGGKEHEFAAEINPRLHVFATHGLGVLKSTSTDDGVVVVPTSLLAQQETTKTIAIELPFNPAALHYEKLTDRRLWALDGARATRDYEAPDEQGRWLLPADVSVGFNAYVETATHHGNVCSTRAGESIFLLTELFDVATGATDANDVRAEWQNTGSVPLVKGFVDIRHVSLVARMNAADTGTVVEPANYVTFHEKDSAEPAIFHSQDKDPVAVKLAAEVDSYMWKQANGSMNIFFGPNAPLSKAYPDYIEHMKCPYDKTTITMNPGSTYAQRLARHPPPAAFYQRTLASALIRADASAEHLLKSVEAQKHSDTLLPSTRYVAKIFAESLAIYANDMVYLDDFTNDAGDTLLAMPATEAGELISPDAPKRSRVQRIRLIRRSRLAKNALRKPKIEISEDYKAGTTFGHADDCEGLAHEIATNFRQFGRASLTENLLSESAASTPELDLLRYFQSMVHDEVYFDQLVLAGVSNKNLVVGVRDIPEKDAMAHTYAAFTPTARILEHVDDAGTGELVDDFLSAKRVREYQSKKKPWHTDLDTLISEGTARASAFSMPISTYYEKEHVAQAVAETRVGLEAQFALMQYLPMGVVSVQMPPTHVTDENNDVMEDRVSASKFYMANASAYITASTDVRIQDGAYALKDEEGNYTSGLHFNLFAKQHWPKNMRFVLYNKLTKKHAGLIDTGLAQLEPLPSLRRDREVAAKREAEGAPEGLKAITQYFYGQETTVRGEATKMLLEDPTRMPMPAKSITIALRAEDVSDAVMKQVAAAVAKTRKYFSAANIHTYYFSEAPVHGDESALPPVVMYDIELRLRVKNV